MARGGINKALVLKAREDVLKMGQNPSIDTIRIALGNTGSKSTIHRYLKELEEESAIRTDDTALLSQPIKELITRLAAGLREDANAIVVQQSEIFEQQIQDLRAKNSESTQALDALNKKHTAQSEALERLEMEQEGKKAALSKFAVDVAKAAQTEVKLTALLEEKQAHIDSLEEKHIHNREALEHYRQSVKEQRDQDQRGHEQQIQQLQGEKRVLNQTLSVKQADITHLNKDNSRLVTELRVAQNLINRLESAKDQLCSEVKSLEASAQSANTELSGYRKLSDVWASEKSNFNKELGEQSTWRQDSIVKLAKLEAEVAIKNDMLERLLAD
jgi:chromosome segregation ATPase